MSSCPRARILLRLPLLLSVLLATLSGCSDISGAFRESFGSEAVPERISVPPPRDGAYPNLATVPEARPAISSPAARARAEERLERERAAARTYDEPLPRAAIAPGPAVASAEATGLLPPPPFFEESSAALAPPPLPPNPPGELVGLIYFPSGSARLAAADRQVLQDVLEVQRRLGGDLVAVGHDSPFGGDPLAAFALSLARAEAVGRALADLGLPDGRLRLEARGSEQPVYAESAASGAAGNRRVEIYLARQAP